MLACGKQNRPNTEYWTDFRRVYCLTSCCPLDDLLQLLRLLSSEPDTALASPESAFDCLFPYTPGPFLVLPDKLYIPALPQLWG